MHERKTAIRSGASGVRIRKVLRIERLESRAVLAGLINVGDSLMEPPSTPQESPPVEVAPVEVAAPELSPPVEPTPPPMEPTVPGPVRPDGIDPTSRPDGDWSEDPTSQDSLVGAVTDPECDPEPPELQDGCPLNKSELQDSPGNGRSSFSQVAASQHDDSFAQMRGQDRPLISLAGTSLSEFELKSSLSAGAATPRSIDAAMSFRYFTDSLESRFADSITLKSESLAPYATADTFVAFELLDVDARHDGDERSGKAVESDQSRHIANRTGQPSAEPTGNNDLASVESEAAIGEAEAAIALAKKIVEEADAACALGPSQADTANVAEASAVSTVAFAAPASSCDAAKPSRQVAFSLHGGIKLGLLSMASIVISMRAAESGNHRKQVPTKCDRV